MGLHFLELVKTTNAGTRGDSTLASAFVPCDGDIIGVIMRREAVPFTGITTLYDVVMGAYLGAAVSIFSADANRPVITLSALSGGAALPGDFPIACVEGHSIALRQKSTNSSPANYIGAIVIIDDGITGGGGSGIVETIQEGLGIAVDATDPANPIVGLVASLGDLLDVDLSGAAVDDVLTYDGGTWVASAPTGGGGGGTPDYSPDNPYTTPSTEDDEFDGGSLDAKWSTFVTLPVITFDVPGLISMKESVTTMTGIAQLPANVDTEWAMKVTNGEGTTGGGRIGFVTYSAGNRRNTFYVADNGPPGTFYSGMWLNNTSEFSQTNMGGDYGADHRTFYMKIKYTASSNKLEFFKSLDGFIWTLIGDNITNSQSMAGAISHIGIYCQGSTTKRSFVHFFRRLQGDFLGTP